MSTNYGMQTKEVSHEDGSTSVQWVNPVYPNLVACDVIAYARISHKDGLTTVQWVQEWCDVGCGTWWRVPRRNGEHRPFQLRTFQLAFPLTRVLAAVLRADAVACCRPDTFADALVSFATSAC
jgi:hypothetical protein